MNIGYSTQTAHRPVSPAHSTVAYDSLIFCRAMAYNNLMLHREKLWLSNRLWYDGHTLLDDHHAKTGDNHVIRVTKESVFENLRPEKIYAVGLSNMMTTINSLQRKA